MSEFDTRSTTRKEVYIVNDVDGVYIDITNDCIEIKEGYSFPAIIPIDKWDAYKSEIDSAIATYQELNIRT